MNTFTHEKVEPTAEKMLRRINPFDRDEFGERLNVDHGAKDEEMVEKMNDLLDEKSREILDMTVEKQKLQTQICMQQDQIKTL